MRVIKKETLRGLFFIRDRGRGKGEEGKDRAGHEKASDRAAKIILTEVLTFTAAFVIITFVDQARAPPRRSLSRVKILRVYAGMAELADAYGSGPYESNFMQVQVLLPAPEKTVNLDTRLAVFSVKSVLRRNKSTSWMKSAIADDIAFGG